MVQAVISLGEREDRILTIVKGKYGLKNKSDAVNFVIDQFGDDLLEPELKPEFIAKMRRIEKEPTRKFKDISELRALIER